MRPFVRVTKSMKRSIIALFSLALAGLLVAGIKVRYATDVGGTGPIYTVAQVQAGLQYNPRTWSGRTILVRGRIMQADWVQGRSVMMTAIPNAAGPLGEPPRCMVTPTGCPSPLTGVLPPTAVVHLRLVPATLCQADPCAALLIRPPGEQPTHDFVWEALHRMPVIGRFVPPPLSRPTVLWGPLLVYRLRVLTPHPPFCAPALCDDAAMLGVAG